MCGRFASNPETVKRVARELRRDKVRLTLLEQVQRRENLAPTQLAPIIRHFGDGLSVDLVRWGMSSGRHPAPVINAKSETVMHLPTFANGWRKHRCLVVADCFYEWNQEKTSAELKKEGRIKQPWRFALEGGAPMVIAGIWDKALVKGGEVDAFAILTTAANETVGQLHDRMPVILQPHHWQTWLDLDRPLDEIRALHVPYVGPMTAEPVSPAINKAGYDGPVEVVTRGEVAVDAPRETPVPPKPEQGELF